MKSFKEAYEFGIRLKNETYMQMLRKEKVIENVLAMHFFENKKILVTGGTGSIGQVVVRELLKYNPRVVRILDFHESEQFEMKHDLADYSNIRFFLGDIRDKERLSRAIEEIDIVFEDFGDNAGVEEKKTKPKQKELKPKKRKQKEIRVLGLVLNNKCCVIRNFEEMQKAKRVFSSLPKTFPQFGLPFMYDDDLSSWPVRVDSRCDRCESTKAREWTFMYSDEELDQVFDF